jgi:hypothetical protein
VTELGSITEGRPGPARHCWTLRFPPIEPTVGGARSGLSQKADRARPGIPGLSDFHQSSPPWGVLGRVRHRRPTGPGPAPPMAVTEPGVRELCVFGGGRWQGKVAVAGAEVSWMSSVSCLLCSRGQRLLGTGNGEQHGPLGRKRIKKNNNEVGQQRISWGTFQK